MNTRCLLSRAGQCDRYSAEQQRHRDEQSPRRTVAPNMSNVDIKCILLIITIVPLVDASCLAMRGEQKHKKIDT